MASVQPIAPIASRQHLALAVLWCFFAGQLAFACVLVPPWQNPDEPQHFAVVRAMAQYPSIELSKRSDVAVQSEVLTSMAQYGFWRAYGEAVPHPFPRRLADVKAHMAGDASGAPEVLYYIAASRYCRWLGVTSVVGQYYALRIASALVTMLTFALVLGTVRLWFGEQVALVAGAVVASVPQFVLIAIAVNPDPVVFFAATFVWWQAARLSGGRKVVVPILLMLATAIVAVFTKHMAAPLLAQAFVLAIVAASTTKRRAAAAAGTVAMIVVVVCVGLFVAGRRLDAVWEIAARNIQLMSLYGAPLLAGSDPFSLRYLLQFTWMMVSTAYLAAGWLRFVAPATVIGAAAVCLAAAFVGGCRAPCRSADRRLRIGVLLSAVFIVIQVASVYGTRYYLPGYTAQGRFLFPAIGPFAAICALGLVRWTPAASRTVVCCGTVGALGALSLVAWATTVVPVYARW